MYGTEIAGACLPAWGQDRMTRGMARAEAGLCRVVAGSISFGMTASCALFVDNFIASLSHVRQVVRVSGTDTDTLFETYPSQSDRKYFHPL